ncbi:DUF4258 domain-containing protein [Desulfotomaculum copahuensis]|uniref:DUF4258 domain-containing protein n=1 Tax=Desulfotomaculum copahuensis TaxID=1838280 RepID=A0A1B7LFP1_9FIRM|nr:DUF4258 domain-containing protein [Desulfotomaculum copahuensis]OAT83490.1 hypothetical protein A6M21_08120 [Desulfotomaculum copahuensis]
MYDGRDRWQEEMARIRRACVRFSRHCRKRIRKRGITAEEVASVVKNGEIIQGHAPGMYRNNPDPVRVIIGYGNGDRILHLVVALHGKTVIMVTAYEPDPEIWEKDCRTLKPPRR